MKVMPARGSSDTSLCFTINEELGGEVLYFKRRDGRLWKLGDGTFGVVYVVHSELRGNDFAVKLLYDNDSTTPRPLSRLPVEAVRAITERVLEEEGWSRERGSTLLDVVVARYQHSDGLGLALSSAGVAEWEAILEKIRHRANSTAVERFNRESKVSGIIRADQLSREKQPQITGTVDIIGSTQRFKSYPAYELLKDDFAEMGVSVSDYALVMDKYEFSMKDLLECGPGASSWFKPAALEKIFVSSSIPETLTTIAPTRQELERIASELDSISEEQRHMLKESIEAPPAGYELLKRMTFEDRIRTALPFLRDIVVGLSRLHRVSYRHGGPLFHLDIKPANVYVRRDDAKGIVCALGDLGFLPPELAFDRTMDTSVDDLPLGTLHFRSPEQKEHFDVANVEARVEGESVVLDVRDPKFAGSFIEKGDSVLFSRDKSRTRHIILEIIPATAALPTRVRIAAGSDIGRQGEQTQVLFLKRQEYRTDLFGIGAIAFDLISCGRSSERFYESIRRFEFDGNGPGSVESTIAKYRRVKDGLADEPELVHIFEPLRHGSEYAPESYVELILRCMLYNAEKTFYAPYGSQRPTAEQLFASPDMEDARSKAILDVLAYIDGPLDYKNNSFTLDNPLITQKPPAPPASKVDRLETILNQLQHPDYNWKLRLARATYYFEKLAALVQDRTKAKDHPFLYQMLPAGIRWLPGNEQSPFQFAYSAYSSERDYENDLVMAEMDKMLKTVTHPFVPYQVAFARREVMLAKVEEAARTVASSGECCNLRFLDAASFASKVRVGDWIVTRASEDERYLWRIAEANGRSERPQTVLRPVVDATPPLFAGGDSAQREAVYYSRIVPLKYYLDVLGLYLLNLLVANSPMTVNDREKVHIDELVARARGPAMTIRPDAAEAELPVGLAGLFDGFSKLFKTGGHQLRDIFHFVARMYLKLTWHDCSSSYYGKSALKGEDAIEPSEILLAVVNDAKSLRNRVEDFLSVPRNTFENERPTERRLQSVTPSAEQEFEDLKAEPLDIKQILLESIW